MTRHSPCVGVCKLDDMTGHCLGCGRTADEVAQWVAMSDAQRDQVWLKLPERLRELSVRVRLLPWTGDEILAWAAEAIAGRRGTWTIGGPNTVAEFACATEPETVIEAEGAVVARASDASFRLRCPDKLRAFAVADGPIVLGLPNGRAAMPLSSTLKPLGADLDAIDECRRNDLLFDCGIGTRSSRVSIRTGDARLAGALSACEGRQWSDVMAKVGAEMRLSEPIFVVETAAARIEISARIIQNELSNGGTHGLPKSTTEPSASITLPQYFSQVAIFSHAVVKSAPA